MRAQRTWMVLVLVVLAGMGLAAVSAAGEAGGGAPTRTDRARPHLAGLAGQLAIIAGHNRSVVPGPATANPVLPRGVVADSSGNLYVADAANEVVEKVASDGTLSIVAGVEDHRGAPTAGPATASELDDPYDLALDNAGDLFILDQGNSEIEKVTPAGALSLVDSVPTATSGIAVGSGGTNVYIAEGSAYTVDKYNLNTHATTVVAGTGTSGTPTNNAVADMTPLNYPSDVAVDSSGNLYIADPYINVVEMVTASNGKLTFFAGKAGQPGTPPPGTTGTTATTVNLGQPTSVASLANGTVFIGDTSDDEADEVNTSGKLVVVAGTGAYGAPVAGAAGSSPLGGPSAVAISPTGVLYIGDTTFDEVAEVSSGILSIVAGAAPGGPVVPGPATSTQLASPTSVATDGAGDVFVADPRNEVVEEIAPDGTLSILAGTPGVAGPPNPTKPADQSPLSDPSAVATDAAGNVYITSQANNEVVKVTPGGTLSVVTNTGLNQPQALAVDAAGNVFVANEGSNIVDKVAPDGTVTPFAGTGVSGPATEGTATGSKLHDPAGLAIDAAGNLYIADTANYRVEKVTPAGALSFLAGTGYQAPPKTGAANTVPVYPVGVATDSGGNVYIGDDTGVLDKVAPDGTLSFVTGIVGLTGFPTPGPAASSALRSPNGLAVDAAGNLFIADQTAADVTEVFGPPRSTATAVACSPAALTVGAQTTCTVTVTDTALAAPVAPTGPASLSTSAGTLSAGTCTLAAAGTSAASCSVTLTETAAGTASVTGSYGGDTVHTASAGPPTTVTATAPATTTTAATTTTTTARTTPTPGHAHSGKATVSATTVTVPVTCTGQTGCPVTLTLSVIETLKGKKVTGIAAVAGKKPKSKKKTVVIGSLRATVAGGTTKKLTISLTAAGKRLLAKHSPLHAALTVTQGSTRVSTSTVTLKKPKPKRRHKH